MVSYHRNVSSFLFYCTLPEDKTGGDNCSCFYARNMKVMMVDLTILKRYVGTEQTIVVKQQRSTFNSNFSNKLKEFRHKIA